MEYLFETARLIVRPFCLGDAGFILQLLNDPSFIENIGDRGVRNLKDAERYLLNGPLASYEQHGHGLWHVGLKESDTSIGMAGVLKRDSLDDVDLGYSLSPEFHGQGYAFEVTSAIMTYAREHLGLGRIVAVVDKSNKPSKRILEKLGFTFERKIWFESAGEELELYAWEQR